MMTIFPRIDFVPEPFRKSVPDGRPPSPTFRPAPKSYSRWPAASYNDHAAGLSERQANFYRNLIGLALVTDSNELPVDFEDESGQRWYLDRGCVKIAEHAGFIRPLQNNDSSHRVGRITLNWDV